MEGPFIRETLVIDKNNIKQFCATPVWYVMTEDKKVKFIKISRKIAQ